MSALSGFEHVFAPARRDGSPTLLLLHGTGGDENDLVPLGRMLDPGAALLAPRGRVLEHGMPRYFRRLAEGVFDLEDLQARTVELAGFLRDAAAEYELDPADVIAVGYSNGANIAASLLLSHPGALAAAVLFRAMVPFDPGPAAGRTLAGVRVLVSQGRLDPIAGVDHGERLAELLRARGAEVTLRLADAGHGLERGDVDAAREWLAPPAAPC